MFNILNLDPLEFEKFCMDFMEKKLNTKFKRFGPGKDDGIDLISLDGKIICQCKRYKDSSNLKTVCQNEYNKIKNTEFEKYYLLTTAELGKKIVENIYEIFHEYMDDCSYIIGKTDIDDFLSDTNNIDVLKKNHKLWLSSSIVLDLYLNRYSDAISKVIINDFENETKFFVETKAYYNAVDIINSNGIILFVGDPGIGKTITSKMLIRYLLANNKDYKLTTVSNNDLSKLIESVHQNDDPEIIFLDDFLGQTSLSLDDKLINDLKNLLKLTTIFNNKKVILNSRITILNKAKHEKEEFEKLLDEIGIKECLIDVNDLSQLDRARILYNLMYHNGVTKKSFNTIKKDNNYNLIINHKSFNTRIIEMCCKRSNRVASENFFNYIIESLNNPKDIWKSEFERIETCDVVLMYQLYTLGNNYIPVDCLHKSVTNYLCNSNSEVEKYSFEDSINRLSKSLIGIAILGKKKYISVLNPSINDYIQNYLLDNMAELKKIYDNALYIEQIDKIVNILPSILEDKIEGFEKLIAYNQYNSFMSNQYLDKKKKINFILKNKYFDKNLINYISDLFNIDIGGNYLIKMAMDEEIREYYNLEEKLSNMDLVSKRFCDADYDYIEELLDYYSTQKIPLTIIEESLEEIYVNALEQKLAIIGEEYAKELINEASADEKFVGEIEEIEVNSDFVYELRTQVEDEINSQSFELINLIKEKGYEMENIKIDVDIIIDNICIERLLDDDLTSFLKDLAVENMEYDYLDMGARDTITIDDIFNQEYDIIN